MSIEALRAKALAHNANVHWDYPLCLDSGLKARVAEAEAALDQARKARETNEQAERPKGKRIGEDRYEQAVAAAEKTLAAAIESAPDDSLLILRFGRVSPDVYQDLQNQAIEDGGKGRLDVARFYRSLTEACWRQALSTSGEDVGLTWDQVRDSAMDSLDYDRVAAGVLALHRSGQTIPFTLESSGRPAMS